ncbi:glucose 1-dehydrogenase [Pseudosulfitobacter koreensis]|uniref:Glucose 1-dehydrogenase n=1 Tax=Pseudosulfitobacter koreensis TaxID=2968472 RepID=A0ABT1YZP7_9RHOB|nr:glucose 1-dehydrogenase [Pseudosulfitobacter koreense]MCR8826368.1 glucose 1-dehydrogenase [Pseudosulfitobacter koreense]
MSDRPLEGRVALVTGASSGIGRASALRLAKAGARLLVNYYDDRQSAEDVVAQIAAAGGSAVAHQTDVSDENQVETMFERCHKDLGPPDVLVANAGIQKDADLISMSADDWDAVLSTNLRGQFLCARAAARAFCARERPSDGASGNIIFMSSVHDSIPWAGRSNYSAAKGGTLMLMKSLAQELGPDKIRVNAVSPGAIMTDINRDAWEDEDSRQDLLKLIPYGRVGEPDDIARAVLWLASDESDYVHGHALYVDGGMMLYPGFREGG